VKRASPLGVPFSTCSTRRHVRGWRCSVERVFPFEDVIFVYICLATAGLEDYVKTLMAPKFNLRAEFIKIITAGVRTCVRIELSMIFGSDKNIQGPCTFYNVPRKYAGFSEGVASRSTATSKVVKVKKTNVEHGTWYCSRKNGLCAAVGTKCRTRMEIEHYPLSKLVRVYLRLHPGSNLSEVLLPKHNDC
jgi:hypothetical protein